MCSNTSNSSGCNGGDSVTQHGRVIFSKKPKRPSVPKRGPGVAELEKILREQEHKSDFFRTNNGGFSLFSPFSNSPFHAFNSPSKPDQVSDLERFSPSRLALTGECGVSETPFRVHNGRGLKSVQIGGSGIFLPEHTLMPTMWDSIEYCDGRKSFQGTNQQFSSPTVDVFSHPAFSSAATTSTTSGPRDLSLEPPSNQASYSHFSSFSPDEDKMGSTKRLRAHSMDLPLLSSTYCHRKSRTETSLPYIVNRQPSDAVSGDLEMDNSSEPNSRGHDNEYGTKHEAFQQRTSSSDQSVENKPVYSFLHKKEQTNFNLNDDAEEDAIDLNLKL